MIALEAYLFGIGTGATFTAAAFAIATVRRLTKAPPK